MAITKAEGSQLSAETTKSVLELLIVIVQLSASLAIQAASDEQLQSLLPLLDAAKNSASLEELIEHTFELYHETAYISGNALLPLLFSSFKDLLYKFWECFAAMYDTDYLLRSDEVFVKCLLARDSEKIDYCINAVTKDSLKQLQSQTVR